MADELESLRKQLEVERGLREAADTENERLQAQVEAYAEDMATLFQEQHGRGADGLAAEVADLRAQLADESAQREVTARLYKKSAQQVREMTDQMVNYGEDLSKAFREGKRSAGAASARPWWRRPAALVPIATTVAGLLVGAGGYATMFPPSSAAADGPVYGPPIPADLARPGVVVAADGKLQTLGTGGPGGPLDPAALAATAAAGAFAPPDAMKILGGTPGADATGTASAGRTAVASASPGRGSSGTATPPPDAQAATALAAVVGTRAATPSAAATTGADLAPTVTVFAATGTALSGAATGVAASATAAARTPLPSPTPTLAVIDLSSPSQKKERCRFELLLPVLPPGAGYAIKFAQRQSADVVLLWSDDGGSVVLDHVDAAGGEQTVARGSGAGAGVVVRDAAAGDYRAHLVRGGGGAADSRVALFYDTGGACIPGPSGQEEGGTGAGGGGSGAGQPTTNPTTAAAVTTLASTPIPTPASTPVPTAVATALPTLAPTAVPTVTPVRPYVDCQPHLRGPSGVLDLSPKVWTDAARSVLGAWPLHAHLQGPGVDQSLDFRATPDGPTQQLPLGGFGAYHLKVDADGADLDPDCDWEFDHDRYT